MKVKLVRPFRYGPHLFEKDEVGLETEVSYPLTFQGKPVYAFYVKFPSHRLPVGVLKSEVEILEDRNGNQRL